MKKFIRLAVLASLMALPVVSPAQADEPIWNASFEDCVVPGNAPEFPDFATAKGSSDPIVLNLWTDPLNCNGWTPSGQAWLVQYVSGPSFPDGTKGIWLNEGQSGSNNGSISTSVSGLTVGNEYELALTAWTDDQDEATTLSLKVTNGTDEIERALNLAAGASKQVLSAKFVAAAETVSLTLTGSTSTAGSPVFDGASLVDLGLFGAVEEEVDEPTLADTGLDSGNLLLAGLVLVLAGAGLVLRSRRTVK